MSPREAGCYVDTLDIRCGRPTVPYCNCFPLYIGRLKITVFHFLFSCTMIFSILWVYIYTHLYISIHIYTDLTRATSSTAPWCEPCTAETLRLPRSVSLSTKYSTYYLLYIYYLFSMHSYNFNFSLTISNSNIPQCHIM